MPSAFLTWSIVSLYRFAYHTFQYNRGHGATQPQSYTESTTLYNELTNHRSDPVEQSASKCRLDSEWLCINARTAGSDQTGVGDVGASKASFTASELFSGAFYAAIVRYSSQRDLIGPGPVVPGRTDKSVIRGRDELTLLVCVGWSDKRE
jgi:hypothetical protein